MAVITVKSGQLLGDAKKLDKNNTKIRYKKGNLWYNLPLLRQVAAKQYVIESISLLNYWSLYLNGK